MARRSGMSLTEVLIAMFVLTIGMLGVLAFFPAGAVNMAQSVRDDRTATLAANSDAMLRVAWKATWTDINGSSVDYNTALNNEPLLSLLDSNGVSTVDPLVPSPGNPVLIDPVGFLTNAGLPSQSWVGGSGGQGILSRRSLRFLTDSYNGSAWTQFPKNQQISNAIRYTSLMDDLSFDDRGFARLVEGSEITPPSNPAKLGSQYPYSREAPASGRIDRGTRYNVAWLIQRPKNNVRDLVTVNVLAFQNRPVSDVPSGEYTFSPVPIQSQATRVTIPGGAGSRPPLNKGGWILITSRPGFPGGGTLYPMAEFYRVTGIADSASGTDLDIDLQTPIRSQGGSYFAVVTVFENLVEVFDRGTMSSTSAPAP